MNTYTCDDSLGLLAAVIETVKGMDEIQASTVTLHFHLSMQGIIMDGLPWPYSDVGNGAEVRAETQRRLKAVYVDPILEAAKMTARAPIININHDPRFIALASNPGKAAHDRITAFLAMGSYVALELRRTRMCGNSWIVILVQNNGMPPEACLHWLPNAVMGCRWARR